MTPNGIKAWQKKVDAILKLSRPTTLKQLRSCLGLVTYYRDMWPRRSHILAPLTDLLRLKKGSKLPWNDECNKSFEAMKAMVSADVLLAYPDHNKPFHIETDASDYQLGSVIKQDGRPVAYYTRKLNNAQKNNTTIEKELLSIVETFCQFRSMLLGAKLFVYTDHRNLTHKLSQFTTQHVLRWRLLLEEYGPTFAYLPGPQNVIADALSRVPTTLVHFLVNMPTSQSPRPPPVPGPSSTSRIDSYSSLLSSPDMASHLTTYLPLAEGLLAMPERVRKTARLSRARLQPTQTHPYSVTARLFCTIHIFFYPRLDAQGRQPFHFPTLHHYQQQDQSFLSQVRSTSSRFFSQSLGGYDIVCYRELPDTNSSWRIAIPDALLDPLVNWYHLATNHLEGMDRLESTIA